MGERLRAYEETQQRRSPLRETGLPVFDRFSELYPLAYEQGALSTKTLELAALAISVVRDCEDCITYHMIRLRELGASRAETLQLFALTLVVGGSTVIPTLRRSAMFLDELEEAQPRRHEVNEEQTPTRTLAAARGVGAGDVSESEGARTDVRCHTDPHAEAGCRGDVRPRSVHEQSSSSCVATGGIA